MDADQVVVQLGGRSFTYLPDSKARDVLEGVTGNPGGSVRNSVTRIMYAGTMSVPSGQYQVVPPQVGAGAVAARDVLRTAYPEVPVEDASSSSSSTHMRPYKNMKVAAWDLDNSDIDRYLTARIGGVVLTHDPRYTGDDHDSGLESEHHANRAFSDFVGKPVAAVLSSLGVRVRFVEAPSADAEKGRADFAICWGGGRGTEVVVGEGKTPAVLKDVEVINETTRASEASVRKASEQACCYIKTRCLRYGFLTCLHGTFFIKRLEDHKYAFSRPVLCTDTQPSVAEVLAYIALKANNEGTWTDSSQSALGATSVSAMEQDAPPLAAGGCLQRSARRSLRLAAVAELQAQPGQQHRQLSCLCHPEAALQLSDTTLGKGQTGRVRLASFYGKPCAVKMVDACKQAELVRSLKNEAAAYDQLAMLQGSTIPELLGHGYWMSGCVFFLATARVEGHHPDPATRDALLPAEEALQRIHGLGLVHGDVRADNILLQQTPGGTYKVWFLDFGHSHAPADPEEFMDELQELRALFRASDSSNASDGNCYPQA